MTDTAWIALFGIVGILSIVALAAMDLYFGKRRRI